MYTPDKDVVDPNVLEVRRGKLARPAPVLPPEVVDLILASNLKLVKVWPAKDWGGKGAGVILAHPTLPRQFCLDRDATLPPWITDARTRSNLSIIRQSLARCGHVV
ncbi:MAG: hypothetical protein A2589_00080 [Candidatus Vogelbacteria bacterium RIFOXYD1_FULL_46_19]|uniref:Uncharacterized protein n=1 Tax=Candidatus Vogelbacteria bacterium RIFOXYD1_FULL_46_19 TaxID=1802439 RepID=A0A1G2QI91_9BACT|nr:MAG: hypothetical protein A2589_00080 [Candidatus Vogelbacteria bacterium RIFOXYD1_FULL_46_19]